MAVLSAQAEAATQPAFMLEAKQHVFMPQVLKIPANIKVKLTIRNEGSEAIEFESDDFSREIVVPAYHDTVIYLGPLKPGRYTYFNDFDAQVRGSVVAQ
ncbi:MAG: cupredoxin domain-containing protein [Pseudomonadales bacterium]|nr:cupredoxin domain-containing protein [Pseudomonadales bacterium]